MCPPVSDAMAVVRRHRQRSRYRNERLLQAEEVEVERLGR